MVERDTAEKWKHSLSKHLINHCMTTPYAKMMQRLSHKPRTIVAISKLMLIHDSHQQMS